MMIKISKNPKTNYLLNEILLQIKEMENYKEEIKRYKKEFPFEIDYNIVKYGNLLIYYSDVIELFKHCGYKKMSENKAWNLYQIYVRRIVDYILKH